MPRLTSRLIDSVEPKSEGLKFVWDNDPSGFGLRVTKRGSKSFVLRYVVSGRERLYTIGKTADLKPTQAREIAHRLRGRIANGEDPLRERMEDRTASSVADLAELYLERHAVPLKRPASVRDDKAMISRFIKPEIGARKASELRRHELTKLHQKLSKTPYQANRVLSLLSKMFSLAVQWDIRADNPVVGIQRYQEEPRQKWMSVDEMRRLSNALGKLPDQQAANAIRLLVLTGARKSEILKMRWGEIDFERGVWCKPSAHTKQKREEHVPLSAPALSLLSLMQSEVEQDAVWVFAAPGRAGHLTDVRTAWERACSLAELVKLTGHKVGRDGKPIDVYKPTIRLHDLRHTYASHLVSSGLSLEIVGRLLGHTQASTTKRYAHFADSPLREATDRYAMLVADESPQRLIAR